MLVSPQGWSSWLWRGFNTAEVVGSIRIPCMIMASLPLFWPVMRPKFAYLGELFFCSWCLLWNFLLLNGVGAPMGVKCGDEVPQTCYVWCSCSRYCLFAMKTHNDRRSIFGRFLHLTAVWKAENQTNSTSAEHQVWSLTWLDSDAK